MPVGQIQWYHFGVGAPPILEPILVGIESDVHWGLTGLLTHGQMIESWRVGLKPGIQHPDQHIGRVLSSRVESCPVGMGCAPKCLEKKNRVLDLPAWVWVKTVLGSHFGVFGTPPILVGIESDVHWGCELLTHGRIGKLFRWACAPSLLGRIDFPWLPLGQLSAIRLGASHPVNEVQIANF